MGSAEEVGAVISDLETEYARSRKFLADLCRSLEARGALKQFRLIEDSSLATTEFDGPATFTRDINPFATFDLSEESSGLSDCSERSTSAPLPPGPHSPAHHSPNSSISPAAHANPRSNNQRRGDSRPVAKSSSPSRTRASVGPPLVMKASTPFPSCPCAEPPYQDGAPDRPTAVFINSMNGGPPRPQPSMVGGCSSLEPPLAAAYLLMPPPQPVLGGARHRRSSLDFIPAPSVHHRKWLDSSFPGAQQSSLPPALSSSPSHSPLATAGAGNAQEGIKSCPAMKRRSLEILGSPAAARPFSAAGHRSSNSGAAPGGCSAYGGGGSLGSSACSGCGNSILSRTSGCGARRNSVGMYSQSFACHMQQQLEQDQQQQQPLGMESPESAPGAPLLGATSVARAASLIARSVTEVGGPAAGSPLATAFSGHLPLLAPSSSISTLGPALTSPGATKGVATAAAVPHISPEVDNGSSGAGGGGGSGCSYSSGVVSSTVCANSGGGSAGTMHHIGFNGLLPSAGSSLAGSSIPSDLRARSGRFSRCSLGSQPATTAAAAPASGPAAAMATTVAIAAASHGHPASTSRDQERRALSSGHVSEPLVPRLSLILSGLGLGGGGNGGGSGGGGGVRPSSFSTRGADALLNLGDSEPRGGGADDDADVLTATLPLLHLHNIQSQHHTQHPLHLQRHQQPYHALPGTSTRKSETKATRLLASTGPQQL